MLSAVLQGIADRTDFNAWHDWVNTHYEVPFISLTVYLIITHLGPYAVRKPLNLRLVNSLWNISICLFSAIGAYYSCTRLWELLTAKEVSGLSPKLPNYFYKYPNTLVDHSTMSPAMKRNVFLKEDGTYGLQGSLDTAICVYRDDLYRRGIHGVISLGFMLSKIPELIDTVLLVAHKKEVIFLHWFHHTTVLLFCWHGWVNPSTTLLWTAAINYSIHTVMYLYYFLATLNIKWLRKYGKFITLAQILQMIIGVGYMGYAIYNDVFGKGCDTDFLHCQLFLWMFVSYGILFSNFYLQRFVFKKAKKQVQ